MTNVKKNVKKRKKLKKLRNVRNNESAFASSDCKKIEFLIFWKYKGYSNIM